MAQQTRLQVTGEVLRQRLRRRLAARLVLLRRFVRSWQCRFRPSGARARARPLVPAFVSTRKSLDGANEHVAGDWNRQQLDVHVDVHDPRETEPGVHREFPVAQEVADAVRAQSQGAQEHEALIRVPDDVQAHQDARQELVEPGVELEVLAERVAVRGVKPARRRIRQQVPEELCELRPQAPSGGRGGLAVGVPEVLQPAHHLQRQRLQLEPLAEPRVDDDVLAHGLHHSAHAVRGVVLDVLQHHGDGTARDEDDALHFVDAGSQEGQHEGHEDGARLGGLAPLAAGAVRGDVGLPLLEFPAAPHADAAGVAKLQEALEGDVEGGGDLSHECLLAELHHSREQLQRGARQADSARGAECQVQDSDVLGGEQLLGGGHGQGHVRGRHVREQGHEYLYDVDGLAAARTEAGLVKGVEHL